MLYSLCCISNKELSEALEGSDWLPDVPEVQKSGLGVADAALFTVRPDLLRLGNMSSVQSRAHHRPIRGGHPVLQKKKLMSKEWIFTQFATRFATDLYSTENPKQPLKT